MPPPRPRQRTTCSRASPANAAAASLLNVLPDSSRPAPSSRCNAATLGLAILLIPALLCTPFLFFRGKRSSASRHASIGAAGAGAPPRGGGRRDASGRPRPQACLNTRQGPHRVADDQGRVCDLYAATRGCCGGPSTVEDTCTGCDLGNGCCFEYEFCVACCVRHHTSQTNSSTARANHQGRRVGEEGGRGGGGGDEGARLGDGERSRNVEVAGSPHRHSRRRRRRWTKFQRRRSMFRHCQHACRTNSESLFHQRRYRRAQRHCFTPDGGD
jgi:hypothetical protein